MGKKILFLIIVLLSISIHFYAQLTVTWTGLGDGTSWYDGANWDSGSEPATGDYAAINITGTRYKHSCKATSMGCSRGKTGFRFDYCTNSGS
jgi:hypothetical protein